ncbi:MAG: hypothetical protein WAW15_02010 [Minisyncoccales bacterium]
MAKTVVVISESESGRNQKFHDNRTGEDMTRPEFVKKIENGEYESYHIREINGIKTPVSNPDQKESNNLD